MPEGHTLRRLADALGVAFAGRPVRTSSPQGRFAAEAALLDGSVLREADSTGKHLFLGFDDDRVVHVHLGLYGRFDVTAGPATPPVGQVRLRLETGAPAPAFADLRGATRCALVTPADRDAVLARLGPDPLRPGADPGPAWRRVAASNRAIGELLMDQEVLAGVGNVYRAEVLFRHRLNPFRPGRSLRRPQFQRVWDDLVALMADGVQRGRIVTVRPEDADRTAALALADDTAGGDVPAGQPRRTRRGGEVYVYRRHDLPCYLCGTRVRTEELAGRNAYWCPRCQPAYRSRATPARGGTGAGRRRRG